MAEYGLGGKSEVHLEMVSLNMVLSDPMECEEGRPMTYAWS